MQPGFDIEKYLNHSKKVDVTDLDFSAARSYPLSENEIRCLTYMMDIESHTIVFLKGILSTCALKDPETTAFLSCWAYEEFFHGRTIKKFLESCGLEFSPTRAAELQKDATFREWLEGIGASFLCQLTRHFHAVYLTWGAISELTTLEAYGVLADRTANPILARLLRRLAKDERRHFSFYYNKARRQLDRRHAQQLTSLILKKFWLPVGAGMKPDEEVAFISRFVLGDSAGAIVANRIDSTIAKLPGMGWFDRLRLTREAALSPANRPGAVARLERSAILADGRAQ
jgi:rubrerythrin